MNLTVDDIIKATGGRLIYGSPDAFFSGVSIDSRTIAGGELFVPLKGQRFDGHDFLKEALRGGNGALVSSPPAEPVKGKTIIFIKNTLKALQDMAHFVRMKSGITVIGITGTNGKTTTKEMIASILGIGHRVLKTSGNLNNHIGLPLSLMKMGNEDEFAVLEMGASIKGDIRLLCEIAVPDFGVITNVGMGHLEGFGSLDVVRSTKLELLDAVRTVALNADDAFLMEGLPGGAAIGKRPAVITFGIIDRAGVYARDITLDERGSVFTLCLDRGRCGKVTLRVPGRFNIYNALAAASLCNALGIEAEDIKRGIESFVGVPMRLELKEFLGATVISDMYNANPVSMEEAVKELVRLRKKRAIAVLGDMLELGSYAEEAHRKLGKWMSGIPVDIFIAVGPLMSKAADEFSSAREEGSSRAENGSWREDVHSRVFAVSDSSEARRVLLDLCREGDTVLVKGSRETRMEKVFEGRSAASVPEEEGVKDAL